MHENIIPSAGLNMATNRAIAHTIDLFTLSHERAVVFLKKGTRKRVNRQRDNLIVKVQMEYIPQARSAISNRRKKKRAASAEKN